jgi:TATA-box binding protein (TBP) (component of TFIID and TFIIIB)
MEETREYLSELHDARHQLLEREDYPVPSWVRITTITMTSKIMDGEWFNLPKFREIFKKMGGKIRIRIRNSAFKGFEWVMKDTSFYNQVTVSYRDAYSTKSIKLFPNGSIQGAGCSTLMDCHRALSMLGLLLQRVFSLADAPKLAEPTVQMINTNFSLNSSVNLKKVIDKFGNSAQFSVTFDPEKYSAVKIKFEPCPGMKKVTASIFSTGKVIVTGARSLKEIVAAYKTINTVITRSELVQRVENVETFDVFMGVKIEDLIRKIKCL